VQFVAFDDLDGGPQPLLDALGEGLATAAAIHQHALHASEIRLAAVDGRQRAVPIGHLGRGDGYGIRQSLRVHRNGSPIHGTFLPAPYPFCSSLLVFFTLCASRIKKLVKALRTCFSRAAPTEFLMPSPGRSLRPHPDALHLAKEEYTVTQPANPSGSMRHGQPLLSR